MCIGLLLSSAGAFGAVVASANQPTHFISLSLAGGEGNTLSFGQEKGLSPYITDWFGANAQLGLAYEFQYRRCIVNVGISGSYYLTNQKIPGSVSDDFNGTDKGNAYTFSYVYTRMNNRQQNAFAEVPVQVGYMFSPNFYALVGAKFRMNLYDAYKVDATMHTVLDMTSAGAATVFDGSLASVGEEGTLGVCPPMDFTSSGSHPLYKFSLGLTAEAGYMFPVEEKQKTRMRLGVYFEYGMPVPSYSLDNVPMGDYSSVGTNYLKQNTSLLRDNLQLPGMLQMGALNRYHHTMAAGLRFTVLFDVTTHRYSCHCNKEHKIKKQRSKNKNISLF